MSETVYTPADANIEPNREDALHFLRILWGDTPPCGVFSSSVFNPNQLHSFHNTPEELVDKVMELTVSREVYYRVGLMGARPSSGRGDSNATTCIPGFYVEVDFGEVGHAEKNIPPTLEAALELVHGLEIVPSLTVESGGGIHCYWLLDHPQEVTEENRTELSRIQGKIWAMVKTAGRARGWNLDNVSDFARVLRLPGTLNHKHTPPRLVRLSDDSEPTRYGLELLNGLADPPEDYNTPEPYQAGERPSDGVLSHADVVIEKCQFIQHCDEDAACLPEPHWWAMVSNLAFCEGGAEAIHSLSRTYPGYTKAETASKIEQAQRAAGPHTCQYIQNYLCEDYCQGCKYKGVVKAPIVLGIPGESVKARVVNELNQKVAWGLHHADSEWTEFYVYAEKEDGVEHFGFISQATLKNIYKDQKVAIEVGEGKDKKAVVKSKFEIWDSHPSRKKYAGIGVFPLGKEGNALNLFRGFGCYYYPGDWSRINNHIFEVLCGGSQEHYEYFLNWCAFIIQNVGVKKVKTAIVLKSEPQTGKNLFIDEVLGKIFDKHYIMVNSPDKLVGRFNGHLKDKLLIFASDSYWAGYKQDGDKLKSMITDTEQTVEKKGVDVFRIKDYAAFIISSNNDFAAQGALGDKRYVYFDVSDKYENNSTYFDNLYQEINNGGREAFLMEMLHRDISNFYPQTRPQGKGRLHDFFYTASDVELWWFQCLANGEIVGDDLNCLRWKEHPSSEEVWGMFDSFRNDKKNDISERKKQTTIRTFKGLLGRLMPKGHVVYNEKTKVNNKHVLNIPSLEDCRAVFERKLSMEGKVSWAEWESDKTTPRGNHSYVPVVDRMPDMPPDVRPN